MERIVEIVITLVAVVFGVVIILNQDLSLIGNYGKTLLILGVFGIVMTSVGTMFSYKGEDADLHTKKISLVYFVIVIIFGAMTLYKGKEFIALIS
jgi:hypothetical protein